MTPIDKIRALMKGGDLFTREDVYVIAEEYAEWKADWKVEEYVGWKSGECSKEMEGIFWHRVDLGDLPTEGGKYWCKLKGGDGYCILQWFNKKQQWNTHYGTEVLAWCELPKYEPENE